MSEPIEIEGSQLKWVGPTDKQAICNDSGLMLFYFSSAYAAKANEGSKDAEETKNIVKAIHETKEKVTAETAKLTQLKEEKKKHQVQSTLTNSSVDA